MTRSSYRVRSRCRQRGRGYLNNRYYDPQTGLFLSVDPLVASTTDPYLYAAGNPTTLSDPTGLEPGCGATSTSATSCGAAHHAADAFSVLCFQDAADSYGGGVDLSNGLSAGLKHRWHNDWNRTLLERTAFFMEIGGRNGGLQVDASEVAREPSTTDIQLDDLPGWARRGAMRGQIDQFIVLSELSYLAIGGGEIGAGGAQAGTVVDEGLPGLSADASQLEAKFKHAADFGVTEPRGALGFEAFGKAIDSFIGDPNTVRVVGTYRGDPAILNFNPSTAQVVVQAPDGSFISGWQMSPAQLQNVLSRGSLGGG